LFLVSFSVFNFIHSNAQITASSSDKTSNIDYMAIANTSISDTGKLIKNITTNIGGNLVLLLSSAAFVLFLWGLVRFIFDRANGDDTRLQKDKEAMGWGLAALFVLFSVWGIIKMFQGFLGIENSGDINIPKLCVNGSCDKAGGSVSGGGIKTDGKFDDTTSKLDIAVDGTYDIESIRWWNLPLKEGKANASIEVAQLQQFLKEHNYASYLGTTGPNKDGVDGYFGLSTTAAVKAFQKNNSLVQDGIVGIGTKAVILYRYMDARPDKDIYYVESWPDIMTSGQSTDANTAGMVSNLQSFLYQQGYDLGNTGTHGIDGIYGGKTSVAVKTFQAKYYLKEDNLVGSSTKAVIMFVENGNK
jgi:peptidoglycan hydrolase-like protein with peptidoglycan-binding domain